MHNYHFPLSEKHPIIFFMGVGDILDAVRLKLEEFFWKAKGAFAALVARKRTQARILFGLSGIVAVILLVVVTILVLNAADKKVPDSPALFPAEKLSGDEFFLPDEPDFLPSVLLHRGQKERWTAEDAAPFWTDPATLDDNWGDKVEKYVDKLLESVP
jgi:hypothetical protein